MDFNTISKNTVVKLQLMLHQKAGSTRFQHLAQVVGWLEIVSDAFHDVRFLKEPYQ